MAKGRKPHAGRTLRQGASDTAYLPSGEKVWQAVESLYQDQLRPYSRIVRKRLVEQASVNGETGRDCEAHQLRKLCETISGFHVVDEEGGEWSVVFVDRESDFVDIYSLVDEYPEEMWTAAAAYFERLGEGAHASLPGGRYASAHALASRDLAFLRDYTLGQICHITELAISQRKLLGYANGAIVAYGKSTSMLKKSCASDQRALGSVDARGVPYTVADWDTARARLKDILVSAQERGSNHVPISNVKRLFRSLYHLELSETSMGYAKLTELLQDDRFADVCAVQLQDRGYVVVPAAQISREAPCGILLCPGEPLCVDDLQHGTPLASPSLQFPLATPSPSYENACRSSCITGGARVTDPLAVVFQDYPRIALKQRRASDVKTNPLKNLLETLNELSIDSLKADLPNADRGIPAPSRFCADEPLKVEDIDAETVDCVFPTPSPSPQRPDMEFTSIAGKAGWQPLSLPFDSSQSLAGDAEDALSLSEPARTRFCIDEPLCFQELSLPGSAICSPGFPLPTPSPYPQYLRAGAVR